MIRGLRPLGTSRPVLEDAVPPAQPALQGADNAREHSFTLIETLVALSLVCAVALLAHRVFTGVAAGAARLEETRLALDSEMNARRVLGELFGSLEVGTARTGGFAGRPHDVAFTAWTVTPGGWLARRAASLRLEEDRLAVSGLGDEPVALANGVTGIDIDYLLEPGANERWVREWISSVSAPVAVRVRLAGCARRDAGCVDTLLLVVGPRG